ncbi:MAG: guanylate kinase [Candidatus Omnitrophota bacterium]
MSGKLFVISAPSGSGKTTLCAKLLKSFLGKRKLVRSVSATTRAARPGERQDEDYFFLTKGEFLKKKAARQFLEWAKVLGNYYGTPGDFVRRHLRRGNDVLLAIDVQGALKVKRCHDLAAVFIFILPPSLAELSRRLKHRSTETGKEITRRLALAKREISPRNIQQYDYVVVNDTIAESLRKLKRIIVHERGK